MRAHAHSYWWGQLAEEAELAVVVLCRDGEVAYASEHLARVCAKLPEDLVGRNFIREVVAPEDRARAHEHFLGEAGSARGAHAVIAVITSDDRRSYIRWARTMLHPGGDGNVRIGSGVDVTQEMIREREISTERARLAEAQRVARLGSWELDHSSGSLSWSDEVYRLFEVDPGGHLPSYEAFLDSVYPDDREAVDTAYRSSLKTRKPYSIRHRIALSEGRIRWVQERCETDFAVDGRPLISRGTVQDITVTVEAEEAIRRSATMVSSFLQVSPEAVIITDRTGAIQTFSDGAELMFRGKREHMLGRSIEDLIPERYRTDHGKHLRSFAASDRLALKMSERSEIRALRLTGEEFAAEATVSKVPYGSRELFAVIVRDLSERKAYEAALESAKVRAEAANEAKSAFLATMSHEIRTPMNGVLGMLSVLAMEDLKPSQREMVEVAIDAGHGLMEILNDILDYSRIEAGQLRLEFTQFDIKSVLKKAQTLHMFKARAAGVALDIAIEPDVPSSLLGDPARIQQILHNLVGNAVKFTSKGRIDVRAACETSESGGKILVLSVEDTGIGIGKDQLAIIFDRFTQADSSITRKFGGSGLGLSIVKGLVTTMGGWTDVVSEKGKGSCFTVRIPVQTSPLEPVADVDARFTLARSIAPRPVRVLVVEDNVLNADTLRLILDRKGVAASIARNGEEALKLFEPGHFDLVFMDIQMPVLDGESAVKVLRKLEAASGPDAAIVVACTAHVDPDHHADPGRLWRQAHSPLRNGCRCRTGRPRL